MIIQILLILLTIFTVKVQGQGIESVIKLGSTPLKSFENIVVYALPQTTIGIKVKISETQTIAGPYATFANEFLGLSKMPTENDKHYTIDSINIFSFSEVDPQQYYAIKTSKHFNTSNFLSFEEKGLITNPSVISKSQNLNPQPNDKSSTYIGFKELSIYSFYNEKSDTFYKTMLKDTLFIRIPIIKARTEAKTLHDKAKEAAEVITRIRQRKFDILMSEEEALPEVKTFKLALSELERIENEYLSLFIGKKFTSTQTKTYFVTPAKDEEQQELFKFSENSGITENSEDTFSIISISIKKERTTQALYNNFNTLQNIGSNQLLYRIPDFAQVNISNNNKIILSQKLPVFQYGVVVPAAVNW